MSFGGRKDDAAGACLEMMKLVERIAQASPSDPNPRLRLASLDELLGNVYAGYDDGTRKITATNRVELIEARRSYQQALDVLGDTIEKFKVSTASSQDQMKTLQEKRDECDGRLGS